jgi:hypothetical protein
MALTCTLSTENIKCDIRTSPSVSATVKALVAEGRQVATRGVHWQNRLACYTANDGAHKSLKLVPQHQLLGQDGELAGLAEA